MSPLPLPLRAPLIGLLALAAAGCAGTRPGPVAEVVPEPSASPGDAADAAPAERRAASAEPEAAVAEPQGTLTVMAVGDIMIGTDFPQNLLPPQLTPGAGADAILEPDLISLLRSADITFGNYEGTLFDGTGPHKTCGNPNVCYVFRSPEHYGDVLADAGFDAFALANNHSGDFLDGGRRATRAALDRAGIAYAGHDEDGARTATLTAEGLRVGFIAFAPNPGTLSINDHDRAARLVAELAADHDIVVVTFHGGAEGGGATRVTPGTEIFLGENRGDVYAFSRRMIDAGADLVFGHGPHVPRALDLYQDRLIAYSLGNFWTYVVMNIRGLGGVGPILEVELAADGRFVRGHIHGTRQHDRGIPRIDPTNEAAAVIAELTARDMPEAELTIAADGAVTAPLIGF